MDGGAWWAVVHGVVKSRTRLSDFTFTFHFHALEKEMATHSSVLAWRIPRTGQPGGLPPLGSQSQTWLKWLSSSSCSFVLSDFFSMWFVNYQINISFRKYNFITSFLFPVIVAQTRYSNNAIWLSWADYLKQCLSMLFVSLRWLENDNLGDNFNGSLLTYQNLIL